MSNFMLFCILATLQHWSITGTVHRF